MAIYPQNAVFFLGRVCVYRPVGFTYAMGTVPITPDGNRLSPAGRGQDRVAIITFPAVVDRLFDDHGLETHVYNQPLIPQVWRHAEFIQGFGQNLVTQIEQRLRDVQMLMCRFGQATAISARPAQFRRHEIRLLVFLMLACHRCEERAESRVGEKAFV